MDTKDLYAPYASEHIRAFNEKISKDPVYPFAGIRVPMLRRLAKEVDPEDITIRYHEDVTLKGLAIISSRIPFTDKLNAIDALIPYMTTWDHTDVIASSLKPGRKDKEIAKIAEMYHMDEKEVRENMPLNALSQDIVVNKAIELIKANAVAEPVEAEEEKKPAKKTAAKKTAKKAEEAPAEGAEEAPKKKTTRKKKAEETADAE